MLTFLVLTGVVNMAAWGCFLFWRARSGKQATAGGYTPRGDRVLVRRLAATAPQAGEVVLPTSQQKPLNEGIVVAVGPGMLHSGERVPVDLKVGQHVCFLDYAGSAIVVDGEEYLSLRDEEIHGDRGLSQ
jgi:chaperonin GroES